MFNCFSLLKRALGLGLLGLALLTTGAQAKKEPKQAELRWAADPNSGVPYVFIDANGQIMGFEVDVIHAVAKHLGLKPVFIQNTFDSLIPGLRRGLYDVVINGMGRSIGPTPGVRFTHTYLISYGQLVVRAEETQIHTLDDMAGKTLGIYRNWKDGVAPEMIEGMHVRRYAYELNAYEDLLNGRIDAVFLDFPESAYYTSIMEGLRMTGPPIGELNYSMAVLIENSELVDQINEALDALFEDGTLPRILAGWGLWNPKMDAWRGTYTPEASAQEHYKRTIAYQKEGVQNEGRFMRYLALLPIFFHAAFNTIQVSLVAMCLALTLGLVVAVIRVYGPKPLPTLALILTEVVRGTPLLIQLYLIFYGLPHLGIKLPPFIAGVMGLGFNYMAYEAENYRAGLLAIPKGQMEAARALGMSHLQAIRHVIVPQAIRVVIPPITNDFISLLKDSSLLSMITIVELTETYTQLANVHYDFLGLGLIFAAIYLLMGLPFVTLARKTEQSLNRSKKRGSSKARGV